MHLNMQRINSENWFAVKFIFVNVSNFYWQTHLDIIFSVKSQQGLPYVTINLRKLSFVVKSLSQYICKTVVIDIAEIYEV